MLVVAFEHAEGFRLGDEARGPCLEQHLMGLLVVCSSATKCYWMSALMLPRPGWRTLLKTARCGMLRKMPTASRSLAWPGSGPRGAPPRLSRWGAGGFW